jgi:hypothetical protein
MECGSPYGSIDPFSVCTGVYGAPSFQLVIRGSQKYEKPTYQVQKWWVETIWTRVYFGILLPREGPSFTLAGRVGYTCSIGSENEEVGRPHGPTCSWSHHQV